MDKVKQNIIQQQQLDKFNIEKSVVGTEAYYINQDIQKGMSQDEIIEKARSGVYKLTAENKKAGRVGQRYGESKKEDDSLVGKTVSIGTNGIKFKIKSIRDDEATLEALEDIPGGGSKTQVVKVSRLKEFGTFGLMKESTDKREDGKKEKISPKSIRLGDSYMAYEAGNPDAKPEKVKIISRKRDEGGYFDIEVEYENGEKDKWYLSDEDFIFEKI